MSLTELHLGYLPLIDAAPLFIAQALGFAEEEGLALQLRPAPSWSTLRDMLGTGQVVAAHMLAPVPIAIAMGLGGAAAPLEALMVLNLNGNSIGVSRDLADRMRQNGFDFDFADADAARRALFAATDELRIGVPFPFSTHQALIHY
jgi:two-component system, oxyanion-binding sensor